MIIYVQDKKINLLILICYNNKNLNWLALLLTSYSSYASQAFISAPTVKGAIPIKTWKELRDNKIVKQDLDYSCGAASVSTILSEFYSLQVTEEEVLVKMEKDLAASFDDMRQVVQDYGFKGVGLALDFERLRFIKAPVIVYLHYRGENHFSVLRGVNKKGVVWLGDPSWGNRRFSKYQFLQMWETRQDETLKGKVLLIVPKDYDGVSIDKTFFHSPHQNRLLFEGQILRDW